MLERSLAQNEEKLVEVQFALAEYERQLREVRENEVARLQRANEELQGSERGLRAQVQTLTTSKQQLEKIRGLVDAGVEGLHQALALRGEKFKPVLV